VAVDVPSGVSDQPFGDEETRRGAVNRARWALVEVGADVGVGLEGGLIETEYGLMTCAWCAVVDSQGRVGVGGGVNVLLPPAVADKMRQGLELGQAMDALTGLDDTKRHMGAVGILTNGLSDRQEAYVHIVKMALVRFLRPEYYDDDGSSLSTGWLTRFGN
jgi:inosine/xanthosine triphosphatase